MENILEEALKITTTVRRKDYGNIDDNMSHIAILWTAYLKAKYKIDFELDKHDVPSFNILGKMGRTVTAEVEGRQPKRDNFVDVSGYSSIGAEMYGFNK